MGLFDDLFGGGAGKKAAEANRALYAGLEGKGLGYLDTGMANSVPAVQSAITGFRPLSELGANFGQGTEMFQNALGLRGAEGNATARAAFDAGPGYQWQMDQGLEALNRRRSAAGMLNSGNADIDAIKYGQGLAQQGYGQWLGQLGSFVNPQLQAIQAAAQGNLAGNLGLAGLYGQDATNRVNLSAGSVAGMAAANNAEAAAKNAGIGNIFGLLGAVGKLAGGFGKA